MNENLNEKMSEKTSTQFFSKIGLIMLIGTIIVYGVQYGIKFTLTRFTDNKTMIFFAMMMAMYLIAFPIIFRLFKSLPTQNIQKKKMSAFHILVAFLMIYAVTIIGNYIITFAITFFNLLTGITTDNSLLLALDDVSPFVSSFITVICAPIMEELLFRKTIIDRTYHYGEGISILLSGLMFGLFHGNLQQFFYATMIGFAFGFIYVKTGNIKYSILLHMAINFLGTVASTFLLKLIDYQALLEITSNAEANNELLMMYFKDHIVGYIIYCIYLLFIFILVITGIVFWFLSFKKIKLTAGDNALSKSQKIKIVLLNAGMILYCLFWVIQIIIQLFGLI